MLSFHFCLRFDVNFPFSITRLVSVILAEIIPAIKEN